MEIYTPQDVQDKYFTEEVAPEAQVAPEAPQVEEPVAPVQEPPVSDWTPDQFAYKYKGNVYYPKDKDHLIALAQKGHAFETNQEQLNRQLREIEEHKQKYDPYKQLDEFASQNPQFWNKVQELYGQFQNGNLQQDQTNQIDITQHPAFKELQKKNEEIARRMEEDDIRKADEEIDRQLNSLMDKHKQYDWKTDEGYGNLGVRVMRHALEKGYPDIESAFNNLMGDDMRIRAEMESKKKAAEEQKKSNKAGIVAGQMIQPKAKAVNTSKMDWGDITSMVLQNT